MSGVCYCGSCHGCRLAHEAGERYDTTEDEAFERARELAEDDARDERLAEYADDFPTEPTP